MALYAFDGTWNEERSAGEYGRNTNVVKFRDLYTGEGRSFYTKGVGTRLGWLGKLLGGAFGAGGKERLRAAYADLCANFARGDHTIDIVGFSRGAALALEFANTIHKRGVRLESVHVGRPPIRFLGLWDVVGAFGIPINLFGIPFQRINLGYTLKVPNSVAHCYHAMALNESRPAFRVTRLRNAYEVWFKGVHSDVGGGNDNVALSNISLYWMFRKGWLAGLPLKVTPRDLLRNGQAPASESSSRLKPRPRRILRRDRIHYSIPDLTLSSVLDFAVSEVTLETRISEKDE